jgi:FlaA1/EpsC-like NDP-sugar epimerase
VPLMERNPGEAIKDNVLGTMALATLADEWNVLRFVLISTDKAVNPTSVMGSPNSWPSVSCMRAPRNRLPVSW